MNLLGQFFPLGRDLIEWLRINLKTTTLRKKEYFLKQEQICRNIYFIEQGLRRCYYREVDREISSWFMKQA